MDVAAIRGAAKEAVDDIMTDIYQRSGVGDELDAIDPEILHEMRMTWVDIIVDKMKEVR